MFEAIKKLFTKTVQLTSEFFEKAEIVDSPSLNKEESFVSAEIIEEKKPKIKLLKRSRKAL